MKPEIRERLNARVKGMEIIPTMDLTLRPLLEYLDRPFENVDIDELSTLISYDESLTAQCLRVANSPLFGRAKPTESVRAAVLSLGLQRIQGILISSCVGGHLPRTAWVIDPLVFWKHSLGCALVCRKLAERIGYGDMNRAYLAGLLHDLGVLVNSVRFTEQFRAALEMAKSRRIPLEEAEQEVMGFTHCESGRILGEEWALSSAFCEVIEFSGKVAEAHEARPLVALVHLSDQLCRVRDMGYGFYESRQFDMIEDPAWAILVENFPALNDLDLARFTFEMDEDVDEVQGLVNAVYSG